MVLTKDGKKPVCNCREGEQSRSRVIVSMSPSLTFTSISVPYHQVKDDSRALTLGALTLPLARLLTASELTLDQWFQLSGSGPNSRLYMKLVMRVWQWLGSAGGGRPLVFRA